MIEQLSPRELEIVRRLACTNLQIARELGISERAVKRQITKIAVKLGCGGRRKKRYKLLLKALKRGYVVMSEVCDGNSRVRGR